MGLVTKYAGGVVKGFALVAGFSSGHHSFLSHPPPQDLYSPELSNGFSQEFLLESTTGLSNTTYPSYVSCFRIAAILVSISIVLHTQFPPKPIDSKTKGEKTD